MEVTRRSKPSRASAKTATRGRSLGGELCGGGVFDFEGRRRGGGEAASASRTLRSVMRQRPRPSASIAGERKGKARGRERSDTSAALASWRWVARNSAPGVRPSASLRRYDARRRTERVAVVMGRGPFFVQGQGAGEKRRGVGGGYSRAEGCGKMPNGEVWHLAHTRGTLGQRRVCGG